MKTKLIADAGSTKVEWALINSDKETCARFVTEGINALLSDYDSVLSNFRIMSDNIPDNIRIEEINYYGAGCATPEICDKLKNALSSLFPVAEIFVSSDLLGAARSLFMEGKGVACVIGTGSNSCLYDGEKIVCQIPSLGYVLGDEGSGAALGKRLVGDAFKMQLPDNICQQFLERYSLTLPDILHMVYRQPAPNRFLASFVPFLKDNLWNPYIYSLVLDELTEFFKRNVAMYPGAHSLNVNFTGSIAFHFEKILKEAAASQGYNVSKVTESPMEGLIDYHIGKP